MSVLMIDLEATKLTDADIDRIKHPAVAGIIIFSRNFENKNQLKALIDEVRSKKENLLIAVDYEGGRVQRFRQQFTILPAMRDLGYAYEKDSQQALVMSKKIGWLISKELGSVDIDFSFTPVLDIDYASSSIIGDRAFHHNQAIISELANALIEGLSLGGMQGVGKHFPGHGFIKEDTHLETAVDRRELDQIIQQDVGVFKETIKKNLYGIMSAHVVYEKCDKRPSTFSNFCVPSCRACETTPHRSTARAGCNRRTTCRTDTTSQCQELFPELCSVSSRPPRCDGDDATSCCRNLSSESCDPRVRDTSCYPGTTCSTTRRFLV